MTQSTSLELQEALHYSRPEMRSSWGGLGGGMGGWEISRSAVLLLIVLTFAGAAVIVAVGPLPLPSAEKSSVAAEEKKPDARLAPVPSAEKPAPAVETKKPAGGD